MTRPESAESSVQLIKLVADRLEELRTGVALGHEQGHVIEFDRVRNAVHLGHCQLVGLVVFGPVQRVGEPEFGEELRGLEGLGQGWPEPAAGSVAGEGLDRLDDTGQVGELLVARQAGLKGGVVPAVSEPSPAALRSGLDVCG